jgi:predicted regulator of Ras-like GTPase activity (Roadblock/LC7/MglB family)
VALMGSDGIPIAQVQAKDAPRGTLAEDIASAAVEFGRILDDLAKAADALDAGEVAETVITTARFLMVLRRVDADSFLVVALAPTGNLGKARYLIRRHLASIRAEM